jgi:hypothetical protein
MGQVPRGADEGLRRPVRGGVLDEGRLGFGRPRAVVGQDRSRREAGIVRRDHAPRVVEQREAVARLPLRGLEQRQEARTVRDRHDDARRRARAVDEGGCGGEHGSRGAPARGRERREDRPQALDPGNGRVVRGPGQVGLSVVRRRVRSHGPARVDDEGVLERGVAAEEVGEQERRAGRRGPVAREALRQVRHVGRRRLAEHVDAAGHDFRRPLPAAFVEVHPRPVRRARGDDGEGEDRDHDHEGDAVEDVLLQGRGEDGVARGEPSAHPRQPEDGLGEERVQDTAEDLAHEEQRDRVARGPHGAAVHEDVEDEPGREPVDRDREDEAAEPAVEQARAPGLGHEDEGGEAGDVALEQERQQRDEGRQQPRPRAQGHERHEHGGAPEDVLRRLRGQEGEPGQVQAEPDDPEE